MVFKVGTLVSTPNDHYIDLAVGVWNIGIIIGGYSKHFDFSSNLKSVWNI